MEPKPTRDVAHKININSIVSGNFVKEQESSYLVSQDGKKVGRVSVIAIVVNKEQTGNITNFLLDDGTGEVVSRSFEENKKLQGIAVGDCVIVLGRVREYADQKYVSLEIIKKADPLWLKVRSMQTNPVKKSSEINEEAIVKAIPTTQVNEQQDAILPFEKIMSIIKELDEGNGAKIEQVIQNSSLQDTDKIIEKMLERGDIFQNIPGSVKVL